MAYIGMYRHKLDSKNRIFIPAKYRESLGEIFYVVKSVRDNYLRIYHSAEWQKFLDKIDCMEGKKKDLALRSLNSTAVDVTPDDQGRILLPPHLVQHAGISKEAVILGCGPYVEIWAAEAYAEFNEQEDPELMSQLLEEIGL